MAFPWSVVMGQSWAEITLGCSLVKARLPGEEGQTSWMDVYPGKRQGWGLALQPVGSLRATDYVMDKAYTELADSLDPS